MVSGIFIWNYFSLEQRGIVGDMFGAVNALFSGLALAGIVYTIHLQREDLSLQREELRLTRDEMIRSANSQESADKSFKKQVELMHLSNVMISKASLINAYCLTLDVNTQILSGNNIIAGKYKNNLLKEIAELELLQDELKQREKT